MRDLDRHHCQDHSGKMVGHCPTPGGGHIAPLRAEALRARRRRQVRLPRFRRSGGTRRYAALTNTPARLGRGPSSVPGILLPGKTIGTYRKDGGKASWALLGPASRLRFFRGTLFDMTLDTGTSIATWAAFGVAVVTVIAGVVTWAVGQHRSQNDEDAGLKASTADSSWRVTVLALFGVTVTLAALAVLSATRTNTAGHFSTTDVFTDLAGAGALLSGVGTMLVFAAGYWGRRKRSNQQTNAEVLNRAIARIDHSLTPEDIHALADLARAVNGSEDSAKEESRAKLFWAGPPRRP